MIIFSSFILPMALMFLLGNTCGVLMVVSRSVEHRIIAELKRRKAETLAGEKKTVEIWKEIR